MDPDAVVVHLPIPLYNVRTLIPARRRLFVSQGVLPSCLEDLTLTVALP